MFEELALGANKVLMIGPSDRVRDNRIQGDIPSTDSSSPDPRALNNLAIHALTEQPSDSCHD